MPPELPEQHPLSDVCKEIFKNINDNLKDLKERDEKRNGRYDKHCNDGELFRVNINKRLTVVEEGHKSFKGIKALVCTTIVTVILSSFGTIAYFNFTFGRYTKQIEVNTDSLKELNAIHPRQSVQEKAKVNLYQLTNEK